MKYGLDNKIIDKINSVFIKYKEIDKVFLFGSRSKCTFHDNSDIDLAIIGHEISEELLNIIKKQLYNLNIKYEIDVSLFENIKNETIKKHIIERNIVFYNKINNIK